MQSARQPSLVSVPTISELVVSRPHHLRAEQKRSSLEMTKVEIPPPLRALTTPDRASRLMARPRGASRESGDMGVSENRPAKTNAPESKPDVVSPSFPGRQGLSMPQTLTNGFQRGENVAILQQGGVIERSLSWETADPDCAASAHA